MPTDAHYIELKGAQAQTDASSSWRFILLLAVVALASGIANGYNGTVLEGAIPRLQFQGEMVAPLETGLLAGALSLGGLIGSLLCSELATALSRRSLVVAGELTIVTGVLLLATSGTIGPVGTFYQAIVGRTLTGVGVAVCGLAKPLIVSELAPPARRASPNFNPNPDLNPNPNPSPNPDPRHNRMAFFTLTLSTTGWPSSP